MANKVNIYRSKNKNLMRKTANNRLILQEVIIYGGCGQLGRAVLNLFKQNGYKTISIDRVANDQADLNIIVLQDTLKEQGAHVLEALASCESVPGELKMNQTAL